MELSEGFHISQVEPSEQQEKLQLGRVFEKRDHLYLERTPMSTRKIYMFVGVR